MWNVRLDESEAGIKIARRNINKLRYADDTTLMAESEEEPWCEDVMWVQCAQRKYLSYFYLNVGG